MNIVRFHAFLGVSLFAVANDTYSVTLSNDGTVGNVTARLVFYGNNPGSNPPVDPSGLVFTIGTGLNISYVFQGDRWLISTER